MDAWVVFYANHILSISMSVIVGVTMTTHWSSKAFWWARIKMRCAHEWEIYKIDYEVDSEGCRTILDVHQRCAHCIAYRFKDTSP